jgi:hypothetical protein
MQHHFLVSIRMLLVLSCMIKGTMLFMLGWSLLRGAAVPSTISILQKRGHCCCTSVKSSPRQQPAHCRSLRFFRLKRMNSGGGSCTPVDSIKKRWDGMKVRRMTRWTCELLITTEIKHFLLTTYQQQDSQQHTCPIIKSKTCNLSKTFSTILILLASPSFFNLDCCRAGWGGQRAGRQVLLWSWIVLICFVLLLKASRDTHHQGTAGGRTNRSSQDRSHFDY